MRRSTVAAGPPLCWSCQTSTLRAMYATPRETNQAAANRQAIVSRCSISSIVSSRETKLSSPPQPFSPDTYLDLTVADRDYSGTPLTKKLGAKPGADVVVYFTT